MTELVGSGLRRRVELWNENFYLTVTPVSVDITVPFENRPEQLELRMTIDKLTQNINEMLEMLNEKSKKVPGVQV